MIPNVFISSTVEDLQHIRDAIRSRIESLGLNPVLTGRGQSDFATLV